MASVMMPGVAAAQDQWTEVAPGVRRLSRVATYAHTPSHTYRAQALVIDLAHPAVSVVATPPEQRGGTVSQFGQREQLLAAWNTNFFANTSTPCGMMMGHGRLWDNAYQDGCNSGVGVGPGQATHFEGLAPQGPAPHPWITAIASGKPGPILSGGQPAFSYGCATWCAYQPRTGLGMSQDGRTLYVAIIDGRSTLSVGAGLDDLANLMRELGAWHAVNLDGGGSSALWLREAGVVNRPSDGRERAVCCHMGVRYDQAVHDPASYGAELVAVSEPLSAAPGEVVSAWVELRNSGQRPWWSAAPWITSLGTASPRDRDGVMWHESWLSPSRVVSLQAPVAPGQAHRFSFWLRAPQAPGDYEEALSVVLDGLTWLEPVATVRVRVRAPATPDIGQPVSDLGLDDLGLDDLGLDDLGVQEMGEPAQEPGGARPERPLRVEASGSACAAGAAGRPADQAVLSWLILTLGLVLGRACRAGRAGRRRARTARVASPKARRQVARRQ